LILVRLLERYPMRKLQDVGEFSEVSRKRPFLIHAGAKAGGWAARRMGSWCSEAAGR
jgi:hypothetical protein